MSSLEDNPISRKDQKLLILFAAIATVLALAIGGGIAYFTMTDSGQDKVSALSSDFKPVALPDSSLELTQVPEAPVGQLDSSDSSYLNVDMQGREINIREDARQILSGESSSSSSGILPSAEDMRQVSNIGKRFVISSVGLDVALGAMDEVDNVIRPTNFTNAFIVRNHGVGENLAGAANGTLYVAMHATDAGSIAPGNFLIDSTARESRVKVGDAVQVGNLKYKVTEFRREGKSVVSNDESLWDTSIKKRLVIFTCQPNSNDNFVVIAELVN